MDIKELHEVLREMLADVAEFCEKHGIRYSVYCGTLLGAVRHQGFIPWDDDLDLTMPLPDYYRFLAEFPVEMGDKYDLITFRNDKYCRITWMQLAKKNTTFTTRSRIDLDTNWGIYADIFPMIGVPEKKWKKRVQTFMIQTAKSMVRVEYLRHVGFQYTGWRRINLLAYYLPRSFRLWFADMVEKHFWLDPAAAETMGTVDGAMFIEKYTHEQWREFIPAVFDGLEIQIPREYDDLLTRMYGNYMQLPPPEKRKPHFAGDVLFSTDKDYRQMRKELNGETQNDTAR